MRIAHLADVHLDRAFAGLSSQEGDRARQRVRRGLEHCLQVAKDRGCDLITIGGDLWEDENVRIDTRRFVSNALAATGVPVVIITGNHDPYHEGGNYERTEWPPNVTLLKEPIPTEVELEGLSLWGSSWTGTAPTAAFLESIRLAPDRRHILLIHGTAQAVPFFAEASSHCPFDPGKVREAGFDLCLAGHIHGGSCDNGVVYPGSPEPLGWGETGRHSVAIIEMNEEIEVDLVEVNSHHYVRVAIDCTSCRSSDEIAKRIEDGLDPHADPTSHLRVTLTGDIEPACEVPLDVLAETRKEGFAELRLVDETTPGYDLEHIAVQETIQGIFVRGLNEQVAAAPDEGERQVLERAIVAGLRALEGREDVVNVD